MIRLLGVFRSSTGARGARSVRASLDFPADGSSGVSSNVTLADEFVSAVETALDTALRDADTLGFSPFRPEGVRLTVHDSPIPKFGDTSYALAVYGGALAQLVGHSCREDVAATGSIGKDGRLAPVTGLREKWTAARDDGAVHFLHPSGPKDPLLLHGVGLSTTLPAAIIWLGMPAIRSGLAAANTPGAVVSLLRATLEPGGAYYPTGLGQAVQGIGGSNPTLIEAFETQRPAWVRSVLEIVPSLPEIHFDDLCQLLDPRLDFEAAWNDPKRRERFIADSLRALAQTPVDEADAALRGGSALIRVLRCSVDVAPLINEDRIVNALLDLKNLGVRAQQAGIPVEGAVHELNSLLTTMRRISAGTVLAPEEARRPFLQIQPKFALGQVERLEFILPTPEGSVRTGVSHPAALFDESRELAPGLRKDTWSARDSALSSMRFGREVLRRFGHRNLFVFADLGDSRKDPAVISWGDAAGVWPPSIDTLNLVGYLASEGFFHSENESARVLDLGCGTGILGILTARCTRVRKLDLIDNEPSCRLTATTNVLLNFDALHEPRPVPFMQGVEAIPTREQCQVRFLPHDGRALPADIGDHRYDLVFCTPPYVPHLELLKDPNMWRAVAGTGLLRHVLQHWRDFADKLVLQFSEIAMSEIEDLVPTEEPVAINRVGFRIPPLSKFFQPSEPELFKRGKAWREQVGQALIDTDEQPDAVEHAHGFKFFHDVRTYVLEA